jgi:hypothetical protein
MLHQWGLCKIKLLAGLTRLNCEYLPTSNNACCARCFLGMLFVYDRNRNITPAIHKPAVTRLIAGAFRWRKPEA